MSVMLRRHADLEISISIEIEFQDSRRECVMRAWRRGGWTVLEVSSFFQFSTMSRVFPPDPREVH